MKTAPNFLIVGAAKSGTTTLHSLLIENSEIFMPEFKEPHYFSNNHDFNFSVIKDQQSYYSLFDGRNEKAIGEASTAYLYFKDAPEKIHQELPNCKIIALIRNPTERALSMWGHQIREGLEHSDLETAVNQEMAGKVRNNAGVEYGFNYCQLGLLADNIEQYQQLFGNENVFLADYRELRENPQKLVNEICQFLDVEPHQLQDSNKQLNASGKPKVAWVHNFLNSKHPLRKAIVWPLKAILPAHKRHQLWSHLRNLNILMGSRHQLNNQTKAKLDKFFEQENQRISRLLSDNSALRSTH